jgi:DNA-binding response OmpR family regulator
MKILLAEDDDALRNTFTRQLKALGHQVTAFTDGALLCEAMRAGAESDVVWTDLAMPQGDGFSVIRAARACLPSAQVLVVSGLSDGEHVLAAHRAGADHFLTKPFIPSELSAVLRRIESVLTAQRHKVLAWHSFTRCDVEVQVPTDLGVAAATAALFAKLSRSFLDEAGCRGLRTAVHEIVLNSIEHGCLEITRDEKLAALTENRYPELIAARCADPRLAGRVVRARLVADPERGVTITLSDPGPGFDPDALPDPSDPESFLLPLGRGLMMARLLVSELRYTDGGRTATIVARRDDEPAPLSRR